MVELVLVDVATVRPLRGAVLGAGRSKSGPPWPGDDDARTLHFAMREGKQAVATASLAHELRGAVGSEVWRLRGPLVLADKRRKGHGRRLTQAAQAVAQKRGGGLWTVVPLESLPFFSTLGFRASTDKGRGKEDLVLIWHPRP